MFGIGGFELFIIVVFIFVIFGPEKLPEIIKIAGLGIKKFRKAKAEMDQVLQEEIVDPVMKVANEPDPPKKNETSKSTKTTNQKSNNEQNKNSLNKNKSKKATDKISSKSTKTTKQSNTNTKKSKSEASKIKNKSSENVTSNTTVSKNKNTKVNSNNVKVGDK